MGTIKSYEDASKFVGEYQEVTSSSVADNKVALDVYVRGGGSSQPFYITEIETQDTVGDTLIYVGQALPGSTITDEAWQILLIEINKSTGDVRTLYADSKSTFDKIWDVKGNYNYG